MKPNRLHAFERELGMQTACTGFVVSNHIINTELIEFSSTKGPVTNCKRLFWCRSASV